MNWANPGKHFTDVSNVRKQQQRSWQTRDKQVGRRDQELFFILSSNVFVEAEPATNSLEAISDSPFFNIFLKKYKGN